MIDDLEMFRREFVSCNCGVNSNPASGGAFHSPLCDCVLIEEIYKEGRLKILKKKILTYSEEHAKNV